jgi:hypothetical protein
VVDGKLSALLAAILTSITVAMKHTKAGQLSFLPGSYHHMGQLDYRGYRKNVSGCVYHTQPVLKHLSLALKHQDYSTPGPAYIQRLIALVKDQDRTVYHLAISLCNPAHFNEKPAKAQG